MDFISKNHELAWNSALKAIQPTKAQLEHGLELHKHLFAMDGFCFLPEDSWNDKIKEKYNYWFGRHVGHRELAKRTEYARCDAICSDEENSRIFRAALRASGLNCVVQTVAEGKSREEDIRRMGCNFQLLRHFRDTIAQAGSPQEIKEINDSGRIAVVWSINGPPIVGELQSPEQELSWIDDWKHLGVSMMHLSYNRRNFIADGCAEPANGGLSELGLELIKKLNKTGIIVDVPHTGEQSSYEAAKASAKPIMASHTGARALNDFIRCKSDRVLKAIAENGGLVGVYAWAGMLGGSDDLPMLLNHIEYIVKLIGDDHVQIGTDLQYRHGWDTSDLPYYPSSEREFTGNQWWGVWYRNQHKAKNPNEAVTGSLAWINWPLYTVGMVTRGFSDETIEKILGKNFLRVFAANAPDPF